MLNLVESKTNQKELSQACDAAQAILRNQHGITIAKPAAIATISYVFMKELINVLSSMKTPDASVSIDFMDLFEMGIQHNQYEDDENNGNYVPFMFPGVAFKMSSKDDQQDNESESEDEEDEE